MRIIHKKLLLLVGLLAFAVSHPALAVQQTVTGWVGYIWHGQGGAMIFKVYPLEGGSSVDIVRGAAPLDGMAVALTDAYTTGLPVTVLYDTSTPSVIKSVSMAW